VAVYGNATAQIENAQEVLDRHLVSGTTGLCIECGVPGPCQRRETAAGLFFLSQRLPRRTPGATVTELEPAGDFGWFDRKTA